MKNHWDLSGRVLREEEKNDEGTGGKGGWLADFNSVGERSSVLSLVAKVGRINRRHTEYATHHNGFSSHPLPPHPVLSRVVLTRIFFDTYIFDTYMLAIFWTPIV